MGASGLSSSRELVVKIRNTKAKLLENKVLVVTESFCKDELTWNSARHAPCSQLGQWLVGLRGQGMQDWATILGDPAITQEFEKKLDDLHDKRWDEHAELDACEEEATRIIDEAHGCW